MAKSEQYQPSHDEIAHRAREIFEKSGRKAGHDMENWLAAEAQLRAARSSASKAAQPAPAAPAKPAVSQPATSQAQPAGENRGGMRPGNRPATRNGNSMART